jgi:hypothetical protein
MLPCFIYYQQFIEQIYNTYLLFIETVFAASAEEENIFRNFIIKGYLFYELLIGK